MFARALPMFLLAAALATSPAQAQGPPGSGCRADHPATTLSPAPRSGPAGVRICGDDCRARLARARDRFLDLLARWQAGFASPADVWDALAAIAEELREAARLGMEAGGLPGGHAPTRAIEVSEDTGPPG